MGCINVSIERVGGIRGVSVARRGGIRGVSVALVCPVDVSRYLRVMPAEPQVLVWLTPQYGVDYSVASNTNWTVE